MGNPKKNRQLNSQNNNPIEIIKDFGLGVVKTAASDIIGGVFNSATEQLGLSPKNPQVEGTLEPNTSYQFDQITQKEEPKEEMWFGEKKPLRSVDQIEQLVSNTVEIDIQKSINEVLRELKILAKTVKEVTHETQNISVEQAPIRGGKYHVIFFEWILKLIKSAKQKVSESNTWLCAFKSRKQQKGYWQMFKKHGTSFGMSSERSVASSVG